MRFWKIFPMLVIIAAFTFAMLLAYHASAAVESANTISVPVNTVVYGANGSSHVLADEIVPDHLVGTMCDISAQSENNFSVHPDTDLLISSGGKGTSIDDVESGDGLIKLADGQLRLSDTIKVEVILGPDGVFSGGVQVVFTCVPPEPEPTPEPEPEVTPEPEMVPEPEVIPPTTVEQPPPLEAPPAQPMVVQPQFTG